MFNYEIIKFAQKVIKLKYQLNTTLISLKFSLSVMPIIESISLNENNLINFINNFSSLKQNVNNSESCFPINWNTQPIIVTYTFIFTTFFWHTFFMAILLWRSFFPSNSNSISNQDENIENNLNIGILVRIKKYILKFINLTYIFESLKNSIILWRSSMKATRTLFYFFIFIFSFFRMIQFFMMVIFYEIGNSILFVIAFLIYHAASTSFYIAFLILSIIWIEEYLLASSYAPDLTNKLLKKPKIALVFFVIVILVIQIIIYIFEIVSVSLDYKNSDELDTYSSIVDIAQQFYHGFLCLFVVLLFIGLILYSKRKRKRELNFEFNERYIMVLTTAFIVSLIIILKAIANYGFGIYKLVTLIELYQHKKECNIIRSLIIAYRYINSLITIVSALLFDLIPIAIVVFAWRIPTFKSSSSTFSTYNESTPFVVNSTPQRPQRTLDKYRTNVHASGGGREEFDNDGSFYQ